MPQWSESEPTISKRFFLPLRVPAVCVTITNMQETQRGGDRPSYICGRVFAPSCADADNFLVASPRPSLAPPWPINEAKGQAALSRRQIGRGGGSNRLHCPDRERENAAPAGLAGMMSPACCWLGGFSLTACSSLACRPPPAHLTYLKAR